MQILSQVKNSNAPAPARPSRSAAAAVAELRRLADRKTLEGMKRYAIPSDHAVGVPVGKIRDLGKRLGRNHELAQALWETGIYEARMLAAFVDDPALVTPAQMDRWCRDFDNWAICDTICFHLFDKTRPAFRKVDHWAKLKGEFQKRAAFALLASLALHDKEAHMGEFARRLELIDASASDGRNFVKKGVSWALRAIGGRTEELRIAALWIAERMIASDLPSARWIGKDALRDLTSAGVRRRLKAKSRSS